MDKKTIQAIEVLNKALKESFNDFKGAYVYGSKVNGSHVTDSDIDVVAIFLHPVDRKKRMDIWGIVGRIEAKMDVFLDLHPMTREELERNLIYYDAVVNKGIFYDAA